MNKSAEKLIKPNVIIEDQNLNAAGFIQSGKRRFKEVVVVFSDDLFLKSVKYSDAGARNNEREVSADDVYNAVKRIYAAPLQQHKKWNLCFQILEYIFAILVGVGASNLKEMWGLLVCLICLGLILSFLSLFYDDIKYIFERNPEHVAFILVGVLCSLFGLFMLFYTRIIDIRLKLE